MFQIQNPIEATTNTHFIPRFQIQNPIETRSTISSIIACHINIDAELQKQSHHNRLIVIRYYNIEGKEMVI